MNARIFAFKQHRPQEDTIAVPFEEWLGSWNRSSTGSPYLRSGEYSMGIKEMSKTGHHWWVNHTRRSARTLEYTWSEGFPSQEDAQKSLYDYLHNAASVSCNSTYSIAGEEVPEDHYRAFLFLQPAPEPKPVPQVEPQVADAKEPPPASHYLDVIRSKAEGHLRIYPSFKIGEFMVWVESNMDDPDRPNWIRWAAAQKTSRLNLSRRKDEKLRRYAESSD